MPSTKQTRQVATEVEVLVCDGPGCVVEYVYKDTFAHSPPDQWLTLEERLPPIDYSDHKPKQGHLSPPVQFHSWKCLVAWMDHHRLSPTQVNVPLDTEQKE